MHGLQDSGADYIVSYTSACMSCCGHLPLDLQGY
jgi:hypothetical protein